jgi:hypothetical protein
MVLLAYFFIVLYCLSTDFYLLISSFVDLLQIVLVVENYCSHHFV